MNKYIITNDILEYKNKKLHRIQALKDFSDVKKGDLGGYIENKKNLSQKGKCWIYDYGIVLDNSKIRQNAKIKNYALICNDSLITGNSVICDDAIISGECINNSKISGETIKIKL